MPKLRACSSGDPACATGGPRHRFFPGAPMQQYYSQFLARPFDRDGVAHGKLHTEQRWRLVAEPVPTGKPRYLAIADANRRGQRNGRLAPSTDCRPQRKLASRLDIDFRRSRRGYVSTKARPDRVAGRTRHVRARFCKRRQRSDGAPSGNRRLSMNLPPEPDDPSCSTGCRMVGGRRPRPRLAAALPGFRRRAGRQGRGVSWLGRRALVPLQDRLFIAPGAHPACLAFRDPGEAGDVVLRIAHLSGARSIAHNSD